MAAVIPAIGGRAAHSSPLFSQSRIVRQQTMSVERMALSEAFIESKMAPMMVSPAALPHRRPRTAQEAALVEAHRARPYAVASSSTMPPAPLPPQTGTELVPGRALPRLLKPIAHAVSTAAVGLQPFEANEGPAVCWADKPNPHAPVDVGVSLLVKTLSQVDISSATFDCSMGIKVTWNDARMRGQTRVPDDLWTPNIQ